MHLIEEYETELISRLIRGLESIEGVKLFGITERHRMSERAPTVCFQVNGVNSIDGAQFLGDRGVFAWHGNYYALPLTEAIGTEPEGMVRLGCMHYNTVQEVDRAITLVGELSKSVR